MYNRINIELPSTDKEFERWCKWIAKTKYGPDVFLYERKKQHGIDVYWTSQGKYHVIQCKLRVSPNAAELIRQLETDFMEAKKHFGCDLVRFIFAATLPFQEAERTVKRKDCQESLLEVCNRLEKDNNVKVKCWHWNHIKHEISDSPFLLRYLLGIEEGAIFISTDFFENLKSKFSSPHNTEYKRDFYSGKEYVQWYAVMNNWDATRKVYPEVKDTVAKSFNNTYPVAAVVRGEGGCGKSVMLRKLAYDLRNTYTIYWLDYNIEPFLANEWEYDVKIFRNNKYLLIMDDWYRNIERSNNHSLAHRLLNEIKKCGVGSNFGH